MSQRICWITAGNKEKGDGRYHWYVTEGYTVRCVYCGKWVLEGSTTPHWKEYEK